MNKKPAPLRSSFPFALWVLQLRVVELMCRPFGPHNRWGTETGGSATGRGSVGPPALNDSHLNDLRTLRVLRGVSLSAGTLPTTGVQNDSHLRADAGNDGAHTKGSHPDLGSILGIFPGNLCTRRSIRGFRRGRPERRSVIAVVRLFVNCSCQLFTPPGQAGRK
jgi:hypothetical protein